MIEETPITPKPNERGATLPSEWRKFLHRARVLVIKCSVIVLYWKIHHSINSLHKVIIFGNSAKVIAEK